MQYMYTCKGNVHTRMQKHTPEMKELALRFLLNGDDSTKGGVGGGVHCRKAGSPTGSDTLELEFLKDSNSLLE